jgi:hypothetical protein
MMEIVGGLERDALGSAPRTPQFHELEIDLPGQKILVYKRL